LHGHVGVLWTSRRKRRSYLEENVAALAIRLSNDDLARLDELMPQGAAHPGAAPVGAVQAHL
jgi:hypothetical protein